MLRTVWHEQIKPSGLRLWAIVFIIVFSLYSFFDILAFNSYSNMVAELGPSLTSVHIILNAVMALLTSFMVSMTQIKLRLTKSEPLGSTGIPTFSFVFGLLTFGCTPCVVSFLAAVGIAFTPIVFPNGNLLWKMMLVVLITIGVIYILWRIEKSTCKVKI